MLSLLSIDDAAYFIYCWSNKIKSSFDPITRQEIVNDEEKHNNFLFFQTIIKNAVLAGEIPALKKAKGKAADKKILKKLEIPDEYIDELAQYEYWVAWEDLQAFIARPPYIENEYAHGRDALSRIICALINDESKLNDKEFFNYLGQKIQDSEADLSINLGLGDNTLKGACREIIDSFNSMKKK